VFIDGKPDPWGMVINPSYKELKLPVSEFPMLDEFVPTSSLQCQIQNPAPYFGQLAAPLNSLRKIAEAVLDAWPNVQTKCDGAGNATEPFKIGRVDRQGIGARFMLGIVSLGDASRFGLRTASLQTSSTASPTKKFANDDGRTFVAPTNASILAAAGIAKSGGTGSAFSMSMAKLQKTPDAYPGTMLVYTTAKLQGLKKSDAKKVAEFIRIATTEGQVRGSGNGKLPEGYVPITKSGATAALYKAAQKVAGLIEAQKGSPLADAPVAGLSPGDAIAPADAAAKAGGKNDTTQALSTTPTAASSSGTAKILLPLLIVLALLAGLVGPGTRLAARLRMRR
jgi:hypothetical protein